MCWFGALKKVFVLCVPLSGAVVEVIKIMMLLCCTL